MAFTLVNTAPLSALNAADSGAPVYDVFGRRIRSFVPLPAPVGRYDAMLLDFAARIRGRPPLLAGFDARHDRLVQRILLEAQVPRPFAEVHS